MERSLGTSEKALMAMKSNLSFLLKALGSQGRF